ncbi:DNA alkylation repair protein [Roseburia sp. 499]|uniref:DNA alkylation repair protein n=1 Tax=Roseburia sp. 499 TaxID=1261634 RepID=UPI000952CA29|nr:DNA alkylation repair protein [Roseburia sp. 499]WVK69253.1 DNA alkylation repair protein [Roseburia sp. 499]
MREYDNEWIKQQLEQLREPEYQAFTSKLLPGVEHILGVRLPELRKLAKKLAKDNWKEYLEEASDDSMEEIMLQGMTLGYARGEVQEKELFLRKFIPKIDNWSVCDSCCATIKLAKEEPEEMWNFLQEYLQSEQEFEVRFALVQLLDYYVNSTYIGKVLQQIDRIQNKAYYVQMAQAWAVSICYRDFPKETEPFLKQNHLDDFTHNKALQKIVESLKVSKEEKEYIRSLKRKSK